MGIMGWRGRVRDAESSILLGVIPTASYGVAVLGGFGRQGVRVLVSREGAVGRL